jgi:hypothetical protein
LSRNNPIVCHTDIMNLAASIAGIITQSKGLLCESSGFNVHFANVYLVAIDFVSIRWVNGDTAAMRPAFL